MNRKKVVDSVTAGSVPVPDSATVCGLPQALSLTATVPVLGPVAVGVKVTVMVQLSPGAIVPTQALAWL
jgi:hypothetical protein